jgi:hypothetical protein
VLEPKARSSLIEKEPAVVAASDVVLAALLYPVTYEVKWRRRLDPREGRLHHGWPHGLLACSLPLNNAAPRCKAYTCRARGSAAKPPRGRQWYRHSSVRQTAARCGKGPASQFLSTGAAVFNEASSPTMCSEPTGTCIEEPASPLPIGSARPPKQAARNCSLTALKAIRFSVRSNQ